jgi:outer membrane beta-barrel protein
VLVPLFALAGVAHAGKNVLEDQPSIRHKVEMRKARFEITPSFVMSINQDYRHFVGGGLVLQMHITDWLGIGLQGAFGGGIDSGLTSNLNAALPAQETGAQPSVQQFNDHLATINAMFSLYVTVTPFAGKLALFGALFLKYDLYGMAGIGGMNLSNTWDVNNPGAGDALCRNGDPNKCDPLNSGLKIGGMFGVGLHLFFNDWIGLNIELRDYLASTNPGGLDVDGDRRVGPVNQGDSNPDDTISNNFFFSLGLTIMLPPTAKISR